MGEGEKGMIKRKRLLITMAGDSPVRPEGKLRCRLNCPGKGLCVSSYSARCKVTRRAPGQDLHERFAAMRERATLLVVREPPCEVWKGRSMRGAMRKESRGQPRGKAGVSKQVCSV